jgi:hypothetical protein
MDLGRSVDLCVIAAGSAILQGGQRDRSHGKPRRSKETSSQQGLPCGILPISGLFYAIHTMIPCSRSLSAFSVPRDRFV